jgi:SAM-dependent methyltransferase
MDEQARFKSLERQGWNERAQGYDVYTARITNPGIAPLLAAAALAPGLRVLDLCCGTGLVAAAAAAQGASVTGVDISEAMIAEARTKELAAEFEVGDAEALPVTDASFDRVICNFGLYHLPDPDRAILEAARVLKPGGRFAFTTWRGPNVSPLFAIVPGAVQAHGVVDVGLPPAPPPFRLAERGESARVMRDAGFVDIAFANFSAILDCRIDEVIRFLEQGTVRLSMVLRAQSLAARRLIEEEIHRQLLPYAADGILHLPMPGLVVSGSLGRAAAM